MKRKHIAFFFAHCLTPRIFLPVSCLSSLPTWTCQKKICATYVPWPVHRCHCNFPHLGNIKTATNHSPFDKWHHMAPPFLPPRKPKPFLQNISLFTKQNLFAVGLDSLTQVYQEISGTLQGGKRKKKKRRSKLQNKFLKGWLKWSRNINRHIQYTFRF